MLFVTILVVYSTVQLVSSPELQIIIEKAVLSDISKRSVTFRLLAHLPFALYLA